MANDQRITRTMQQGFLHITKALVKKGTIGLRVLNAAIHLKIPGVAVLRYHSIKEDPNEIDSLIGPGLAHSAELFDKQMRLLSRDYQPVDMDDIVDFAARRVKIPRKSVAVTFDDGFADNFETAAPIMNQHGIRGASYVQTGSIAPNPLPWFYLVRRVFHLTQRHGWENPYDGSIHDLTSPDGRRLALIRTSAYFATLDLTSQRTWISTLENELEVPEHQDVSDLMMNESQLRRFKASGHIIGSHSVSHPNIAKISEDRVLFELQESKRVLESILGSEVRHLSYPSPILQPHYSISSIQISKNAGYATGVTCTNGLFIAGDDPLICRRISVPNNMLDFRWKLDRTLAHHGREALYTAD